MGRGVGGGKQPQTICKQAGWLCSNKALLQKKKVDFKLHANYMRGWGDYIFPSPRPWRKTDHSLNPVSFPSLCAPRHVTVLPKSGFPLLGNSAGTTCCCWEVQVQDIHSMPGTNRHSKLGVPFHLQHGALSPVLRVGDAKMKISPPLPSSSSSVYWSL